jgi:hypothetical protein
LAHAESVLSGILSAFTERRRSELFGLVFEAQIDII